MSLLRIVSFFKNDIPGALSTRIITFAWFDGRIYDRQLTSPSRIESCFSSCIIRVRVNDEKGSLMSMKNCLQRCMISNENSVHGCSGSIFPDCVHGSAGNDL